MNSQTKSKDYITEALLQLMHKKKYDDITITSIAYRAGVTRTTIYRNFDSKDDIIKNYLKVVFSDWNCKWKEKDNKNVVYQIFRFFDENRKIIDLLYKSNLQFYLIENILQTYDYKEEDSNRIAYAKVTVAYLVFGWCNEWYKRGMVESPEEMAKLFEKQN